MLSASPSCVPCLRAPALCVGFAALLGVLACGPSPPQPAVATGSDAGEAPASPDSATELFRDQAADSGLDFVHFNGMSGGLYLAEITCAGGGFVDYDDDGDLDVYLLQGAMLGPGKTLADALVPPRRPQSLSDRLYRNEGADDSGGPILRLRFTDVTTEAGLGANTGYGCSLATGDYDGDGRVDLYIANLGPNQLLRNRGDGTFEDVTQSAGAGDDHSTIATAFVDYDGDGDLDLFIANNVDFLLAAPPPCYALTGAADYCGPGAYPFQPDRLLRNRGDGTFEDVTTKAGMAAPPLPSLGVAVADFDGDGRQDLYVANDGQPNRLWINLGDGTFEDRALLAGSAVNANGNAEASMGVDVGDYDRDGDPDLFLAHLVKETNTLYRNDAGQFEDATMAAGLGPASLAFTSFGAGWIDYDNDGWLDLLVVNGAVTHLPELVRLGDPFPLHQPNQLFRNQGADATGRVRFEDVTAQAGPEFARSEVSRAAAFGDVDNDGDLDALVVNNNGPLRLLINQVGQNRRWLGLRLVAGRRPRGVGATDALGARAAVVAGGREVAWLTVRTDGSFNAARDPRLLFGLGGSEPVEAVRVTWPDGQREQWSAIATGRYITLVRGTGDPLEQ